MRLRNLVGGAVAFAIAAFPIMDRTAGARSQISPMQRVSAAAAGAKQVLGAHVRYLSSAWQNALGVEARMEIQKALGTPVNLDQLPALEAPSASMQLISFAPSSAPPNLAALGTRFSGFTTNETSTAWCGSNITVGFNDSGSPFESLGGSVVGYSQSSNTGTSYTDEGALPPFSASGPTLLGDPIVVCNSSKNFFFSSIWTNCTTIDPFTGICVGGTNGVSLSKSNDGGITFGTPTAVVSEDITQHIVDKDWMTVDPNDTTNVFVTYTDFDITGSNPGCNTLGDILASIQVVAFNTAGTPTATIQIAQGACNEVVQGSQVAAARDGTVYSRGKRSALTGSRAKSM